MRFSHFFIDRPIFASVLSIIILIVGGIAQFGLPVSEYPEIAPPTVNVTATYPGASAEVIAQTVATQLELEINGVDDMLYINSTCRTASPWPSRACPRTCSGSASSCARPRPT